VAARAALTRKLSNVTADIGGIAPFDFPPGQGTALLVFC